MSQKTVIIVGGGVGGMSAAHELLHRSTGGVSFNVVMYERRGTIGGKARSIPVPADDPRRGAVNQAFDAPPRLPLPGEHGFRFFPGFYKHITETFKEIPVRGAKGAAGAATVFDRLETVPRLALARLNAPTIILDAKLPTNWQDVLLPIQALFSNTELSKEDLLFFARRIWQIMTSCQERRLAEYEQITWWDYVQASQRSKPYQDLLAEGPSRSLLANDPRRASTRTVGNTNVQLLLGLITPQQAADHVLDAPTSEAWLDPWRAYLQSKYGSRFEVRCDARVTAIKTKGSEIEGVFVEQDARSRAGEAARPSLERADYFVFAVPVERMAELIETSEKTGSGKLLELDPSLEGVLHLKGDVAQMNGIQFFLYRPLSLVKGHYLFVDSPWALTGIAEGQFWPNVNLAERGDGTVRDVLSVCISNWDTPGIVYRRPASDLSRVQIAAEVWAQLKASVNRGGSVLLRDEDLHSWFLDPDIVDAKRRKAGLYVDTEPLFVNRVNTWQFRPEATTKIANMVLASDYVRTFTDIACMEAANEAARRAVNAILDRTGSKAGRCGVWPLHEPDALAPLRAVDKLKFKAGLPWGFPVPGASAAIPSATTTAPITPVTGAPRYVERSGEICHPPPYLCNGTTMFGFFVRGQQAAIQKNVVDRNLNACSGGRFGFRALSDVVMVTFANTARIVSVPESNVGVTPERSCTVWTPVVSTVGIPRFYWHSPYIWVDNPWSMATGREVEGLPKSLGRIDMPSGSDDPSEDLSATTLVLKRFAPSEETQEARVLRVARAGSRGGGANWPSLGDARRDLAGLLLRDSPIATVAASQLALDLLAGEGPETVPIIFLKQVRDVRDSVSACYQAIIEASCKVTAFRSGRHLAGEFGLLAENFSSHPIADDLGLIGGSTLVDFSFFVDIDFEMDVGKELWRAP